MVNKILIDSGPLVAFLASSEKYHRWVLERMGEIDGLLITTESVLSEVVFLMKNNPVALNTLSVMVNQKLLQIYPSLSESPQKCFELLIKYADLPGSVADISLVHLYSTSKKAVIFTLDTDFLVYKTPSGNPLTLIAPFT
jgi:predicted nucleic acid-binding protein